MAKDLRCPRCQLYVVEHEGMRLTAPVNGADVAFEPHHCAVDDYLRCFVPEEVADKKWMTWRRWQERRKVVLG